MVTSRRDLKLLCAADLPFLDIAFSLSGMPLIIPTFILMKDLLLLLSGYPYDPSKRESLSKLTAEVIDWEQFVRLVNDHGIIALTTYNIKEAGLESMLPESVMKTLGNSLMQSMVRNSWLTERWKEANVILSEAGIKHILLKGMALEHTLYGSKGLRQMNDNDILIRREDALRAWSLLQNKGFKPKPLKSPLHKKILPDLGKHLPELYKDGYSLEIHTRLFDENIYNAGFYNDVFEKAIEIHIDKIPALILPTDINISYLVKHFKYHASEGDCQLRLYTDIKLLDSENPLEFPDRFITDPKQKAANIFYRKSYRTTYRAIPSRYRLRFLLGDIFPSVWWMRNRYKCGVAEAILRYPLRLGKVWWVV